MKENGYPWKFDKNKCLQRLKKIEEKSVCAKIQDALFMLYSNLSSLTFC